VQAGTQSPTDEELARDARAGSESAFEQLVYRYEGRIFQFLVRKTANAHDAEDLTQQAFVKAYRALERYNAKYRFSAWLYTIAGRLAVSHYRSRRAAPVAPESIEEADVRTPDAALSARESEGRLWDWAHARLRENEFTALWLRVREDLSVAEISGAMQKTQGHVKVLLFRGRRRLAKAWRQGADGGVVQGVFLQAGRLAAGMAQGGEAR
jgi:RNA polymerase sigma-70 factor, ECF subfamily